MHVGSDAFVTLTTTLTANTEKVSALCVGCTTQWSPSGEHFAVVAGFIPSKVMLFDANCKPLYDFGSGPYNVVRWNPFGRFLVVAGFGNLPGKLRSVRTSNFAGV